MTSITQKMTATKAWVASIGAALTAGIASVATTFPHDDKVQVITGVALGAIGAVVIAFATFKIPNQPVQ